MTMIYSGLLQPTIIILLRIANSFAGLKNKCYFQLNQKEINEEKVSVRRQGKGDQGTKSVDEFIATVVDEIKSKRAE